MTVSEKQCFAMRGLKRTNVNVLDIQDFAREGLEVFIPMKQMFMTIGSKRQRREVPVIQDQLIVHETKGALDPLVAKYPDLQYRYQLGNSITRLLL